MELTSPTFELVENFGYYGKNDIDDVLLFLKEQKGLTFSAVKKCSPYDKSWNCFVQKDASEETIKEFGNVEPRIIYSQKQPPCLSEDEALEDLIYSYLYQESMKEFNKKHNIY